MSTPAQTQLDEWSQRYALLLHEQIQQPSEALLSSAAELGWTLAEARVPLCRIVGLHMEAVQELVGRPERAAAEWVCLVAPLLDRLMEAHADACAKLSETLAQSEQRLREVLDNSRDMIYRVRLPDLCFEYVSPSCERFTGYSPAELMAMGGTRVLQLVHPQDRARFLRAWQKEEERLAVAGGDDDVEFRLVHKDGRCRWFSVARALVRDEHGTPVGAVGTLQDITARKQAETELLHYRQHLEQLVRQRTGELERLNQRLQAELAERRRTEQALRESEERYRLLADSMEDVVNLNDRDGRRLYVSPSFFRVTGYTPEEVLTSDFRLRIHPEDLPLVEAARQANLRGEKTRIEYRCRCRDDSYIWLEVQATPILGSDGRVEKILCCSRNIQERKHAEQAQRESERRFRALAETIPAAVLIVQGDRLRYVNETAARWLGYSVAELLQRSPWEFVHPDDRELLRSRNFSRLAGHPEPARYETRLVTRDGRERWMDFSVAVIEYEGRPAALGAALDITERKLAEERARQHREELAHAARVTTLGEMVSGLAHELAQPLSAILYYARGAASRLAEGTWSGPDAVVTLEKISAQAERAGEFIRRLKAFVRKAPADRARCDLNDIVRDAVSIAAPEARRHRVSVRLELSNRLPAVQVDRIQIEQVLLNLMRNALEAMSESPPDKRELSLRTYAGQDGMIIASVRDTGGGIPAEAAERVFDAFFTSKSMGTGLGLSICRTIIEETHKGRLWVESQPGRGTTFGFALPAAPACAGPPEADN